MFEVGRVCVKIAGRDAGKKCVVVNADEQRILIDGETRRKKVNRLHLEPTTKILKVKKDASHTEVCKALGVDEQKKKSRKAAERPRQKRKEKVKKVIEEKPAPSAQK